MFKKMKQGLSQLSQKSTWLPSIVIVLVAVLLLLPQLTSRGVIAGSDFLFHYNRFYETAMQIKTGNFSYFMSLYGFYSSGRIVKLYMARILLIFKEFWYSLARTGIPINFCHVSC